VSSLPSPHARARNLLLSFYSIFDAAEKDCDLHVWPVVLVVETLKSPPRPSLSSRKDCAGRDHSASVVSLASRAFLDQGHILRRAPLIVPSCLLEGQSASEAVGGRREFLNLVLMSLMLSLTSQIRCISSRDEKRSAVLPLRPSLCQPLCLPNFSLASPHFSYLFCLCDSSCLLQKAKIPYCPQEKPALVSVTRRCALRVRSWFETVWIRRAL
jgi:hypothetical protein